MNVKLKCQSDHVTQNNVLKTSAVQQCECECIYHKIIKCGTISI